MTSILQDKNRRVEPLTHDALGFRKNIWNVLKGKVLTEAPSHSDVCFIGKMVVPLGWYPSGLTPQRSPLKGDYTQ